MIHSAEPFCSLGCTCTQMHFSLRFSITIHYSVIFSAFLSFLTCLTVLTSTVTVKKRIKHVPSKGTSIAVITPYGFIAGTGSSSDVLCALNLLHARMWLDNEQFCHMFVIQNPSYCKQHFGFPFIIISLPFCAS